jgi:hypothetical protein
VPTGEYTPRWLSCFRSSIELGSPGSMFTAKFRCLRSRRSATETGRCLIWLCEASKRYRDQWGAAQGTRRHQGTDQEYWQQFTNKQQAISTGLTHTKRREIHKRSHPLQCRNVIQRAGQDAEVRRYGCHELGREQYFSETFNASQRDVIVAYWGPRQEYRKTHKQRQPVLKDIEERETNRAAETNQA